MTDAGNSAIHDDPDYLRTWIGKQDRRPRRRR